MRTECWQYIYFTEWCLEDIDETNMRLDNMPSFFFFSRRQSSSLFYGIQVPLVFGGHRQYVPVIHLPLLELTQPNMLMLILTLPTKRFIYIYRLPNVAHIYITVMKEPRNLHYLIIKEELHTYIQPVYISKKEH